MKKAVVYILTAVVCVSVGAIGVRTFAATNSGGRMIKWGQVLRDTFYKNEKSDDIYAKGKTATVTCEEMERAVQFYIISGMNEPEAEKEAEQYMMQRAALYEEAVKNGYSVTDEEVYAYLEELKELTEEAENKESIRQIINQFDSEEDYWEYEFYVYQKNLPIQNYVQDMEKAYNQNALTESQDAQSDSWSDYFQQLKENLVQEENFQIVNNI